MSSVARATTALLFLDSHHLSKWDGLQLQLSTPTLLSEYKDPSSFIGWGFPSVFKKRRSGGSGFRMMYQGWHLRDGKEDTKLALLADSEDAIHWVPTTLAVPAYNNVSNAALVNGLEEFSVVFDDADHTIAASDRLKCLWANTSVTSSGDDGETWHAFGRWTSEKIDPGISVCRNPANPAELVVTARPQALRKEDGRHAGFHTGMGWSDLAKAVNRRALPLDNVFTKTDQPYGLPSFAYHGNIVSWFWRYACPAFPCYSKGNVSAALAYSYDARNWTAFGQFPFPTHSSSSSRIDGKGGGGGPIVGRGPLNNTDIGSKAYHHTYTVFANKTEGALACQVECDGDEQCAAWTYVIGGECCGTERCCRHAIVGCTKPNEVGCVSGAKVPTPCNLTPSPSPSPPPVPLPEMFANVPGTASAGQIYPNTLLEIPSEGRILVHSSASTHQHGLVPTAPGTWSSIVTHEIRIDGFTFAAAAVDGVNASFLTQPLLWHGGGLTINADATAGGASRGGMVVVAAAVVDGDESQTRRTTPWSLPFEGNATNATVAFKSGLDEFAALHGATIQIKVVISGAAQLFSLRGNFSWQQ